MRRMVLFIIGISSLAGTASYAHHSYAATYDNSAEVKLEGKVLQFVFRNPHTFVQFQAPNQKGVQQRWAAEWAATSQLTNSGVTRESLKVGDEVVIVGRPSRVSGEHTLLMFTLTRPLDGCT